MLIIFMGVSGCGKTYFGKKIAAIMGYDFIDADDFHSRGNIKKMEQGLPLTDEDRESWLQTLHEVLLEKNHDKQPTLLACSLLKRSYKNKLLKNMEATIIYLQGSYPFILKQMQKRKSHFFPPSLLQSQFDILEIPNEAIAISIEQSEEKILNDMVKKLKNSRSGC